MYHVFRNRGLPTTSIVIPSVNVQNLEQEVEKAAAAGNTDSVVIKVTPEKPATNLSAAQPPMIEISPATTTTRSATIEGKESGVPRPADVTTTASASRLSGLFWALVIVFFKAF